MFAVDRAGHTAAAEVGDCYIVVITDCIGSSMDQGPAAIGFLADTKTSPSHKPISKLLMSVRLMDRSLIPTGILPMSVRSYSGTYLAN